MLLSTDTLLMHLNFQLDGSLADLVLELGYSFCNTVEECRNNLANFGVNSITPAAVAKVLGVMVRTHTGLPSEQVKWWYLFSEYRAGSSSNKNSV